MVAGSFGLSWEYVEGNAGKDIQDEQESHIRNSRRDVGNLPHIIVIIATQNRGNI